MRTFALIVVAALLPLGMTLAPLAADGPALYVPGLFHGAGQPIRATIDGATGPFEIVLLAADGTEKARLALDGGKPTDLGKALPELDEIIVAHWLQLVRGGAPIGAPWVVQPLINRPLVRTARAVRSDGKTQYTRVIGWGDRLLEPDNVEYEKLKETWPKGDPTPRSGVRIYVDRDALLHTDKGDIRVALAPDRAPNTAWNFRTLVEGGFYDGTPFHRVVKFDREGRPFVIQGGDPTATGDGSAGADLCLEPSDLPHDFGVISMARSDPPDSAGSQYFFALSREGTARLDTQYCAFGWAVSGAEAIVAIADSEIADLATGKPKTMPVVTKAELVAAPPRTPGKGRPDARVAPPTPAPPPMRTEPDR